MTDSPSRLPKEDYQEMFDWCVGFAVKMLQKHQEFHPFGAKTSTAGEMIVVQAYDGEEHPSAQSLIDIMTDGYRKESASSSIRACCICVDGRTVPPGSTHKTDAIICDMEHVTWEPMRLFLPYSISHDGVVSTGAVFATVFAPKIFPISYSKN